MTKYMRCDTGTYDGVEATARSEAGQPASTSDPATPPAYDGGDATAPAARPRRRRQGPAVAAASSSAPAPLEHRLGPRSAGVAMAAARRSHIESDLADLAERVETPGGIASSAEPAGVGVPGNATGNGNS